MLAPQTMQPASRQPPARRRNWRSDGIVLLPRGNDGVGIVGAFSIEAPPALPLLLIRARDSAGADPFPHRRAAAWCWRCWNRTRQPRRQCRDASRADGRRLAGGRARAQFAVYERIGGEE